ncbi:hypothetical protein ZWY2020_033103 [Hordeum vulgare]|nr:hypothetical protein ZWY2020_033103 [Hordeum vulgare]
MEMEMPASSNKHAPGSPPRKLRKPLTDELRAIVEEPLARLPVDLRLCPVDPPPIFVNKLALSYLGVLDFARYEILCEFFNCFESSIRLLRMKGSKATFPNI